MRFPTEEPMAKIKLTKTELKAQSDALKRFQRFLPMLQLKKQQLQAEIAGIAAKADEVSARERAARAGVDGIIIMNPQEFASFNAYFSPYPRSRRDRHFYDRRGIPDMFRYRAAAIVKQNKK